MKKVLNSRLAAIAALIIVIAVLIATFSIRTEWWCFIDIFFAFMMTFCHLLAIMIEKMSKAASTKMELIALIFGILTILAIIGEYIAWEAIF